MYFYFNSPHQQRGNVLFLILIAVALFAALAYAVTSSTRGGGGSADKEKVNLNVSRMLSYVSSIQTAITRLTVINGVKDYDLFYNSNFSKRVDGSNINVAIGSPSNPTLYVFHPGGGNIPEVLFNDIFTDPCPTCLSADWRTGHWAMRYTGTGQGSTMGDLTISIAGIPEAECRKINELNGITGIPIVNFTTSITTAGSAPAVMANPSGAGVAAIENKPAFCTQLGATVRYYFMTVLGVY